MLLPNIDAVTTAEQARELAIDWQAWQANKDMSWGEVAMYRDYFKSLAVKFPELAEEFSDNAIV